MQKEREERFCIEDVKHLIHHRKEEIMYVCICLKLHKMYVRTYVCMCISCVYTYIFRYIESYIIFLAIYKLSTVSYELHMYIYTYIIV